MVILITIIFSFSSAFCSAFLHSALPLSTLAGVSLRTFETLLPKTRD